MKGTMRLVLLLVVAALAGGSTSAHSAGAGTLTCQEKTEKPFSPWGDNAYYALAPNGSLEAGSKGWTLKKGAGIVAENNTHRSGSYSLELPSGSFATSPAVCVKASDPASRFFLRSTGSSDGQLKVEVIYKTLLGLTATSTLGYVKAKDSWQPGPKYSHELQNILGTLALNSDLSASIRFKFTPVGRGASFLVDDLFVDPILQF